MNLISPPPVSRGGDQPPEDVDRRLRAFFKAQMPDPWPSLEAPAPRRPATIPFVEPPRRGGLFRSRLALAASVALLATGLFALAEAFQGRPPSLAGPVIHGPGATNLGPDGKPAIPSPSSPLSGPPSLKVSESLIQEPNGTTIKVEVIDWPVPPK